MAPFSVSLDQAELSGDGVLSVGGWAFGGEPVLAVEVHVVGVGAGLAEIGLPRPDVAADFRDEPHAPQSGFQFSSQLGEAALGAERLQVVIRTATGLAASVASPIARPLQHPAGETGTLRFYCDRLVLFEDGEVQVAGWAVHESEIERIEVRLDGAPLGVAEIGGQREDVARDLPYLPSALHSGFEFRTRLSALDPGEHEVELAITTRSGERFARTNKAAAQVGRDGARGVGREDIRLAIDAPKIVYGKFAHPIRRLLSVTGWAIAREGLVSLEAYLDGAPVGAIARGVRRLDIAAAHAEFPEALTSGFSLVLPRKLFSRASHRLRIAARDKRGQVKEVEVGVDVAPEDADDARETLRTFLSVAEIEMKRTLIAASPRRAAFAVAILPGHDPEAPLAGLHVTLRSLEAQAYPAFRAAQVAPGADLAKAAEAMLVGVEGAPFVMRLRAGDRLGADALLELALEIAIRPEENFLYADDRRAFAQGRPTAFFKPEWSPELLLSTNYIGRAWCAELALTAKAGLETDAGDYDAVLRLSEAAAQIGRAAFVALEAGGGGEPARFERAALRASAKRRGWRAGVLPTRAPGVWRLKRRVATRGLVSIIVPTAGARDLVRACVESIRRLTAYRPFEIVVVDNIDDPASSTKAWLKQNADCVVECDEPFNWSRFNNLAAEAALGEFLLFLNDDVEVVLPRWLHALLEQGEQRAVGAVGARLLYPNGRIQHAGMFLSESDGRHAFRFAEADDVGPHGLAAATRDVAGVTGACVLVRREVFQEVGGFDETHAVVNNDLDFCLKIWSAGRRVVYTPHATLIHHEAASRAAMDDSYDEKGFRDKWRLTFALGDPFLNPKLSREDEDYVAEPEPVRTFVTAGPRLERDTVRRILVQKLDHIGDFVTGLAAIRRLKLRFPQAEIFVLAPSASALLAQLEPAVAQVIEFNYFHAVSSEGLIDQGDGALDALEARLKAYRFDIAVDLRKHAETREMLKRSGARLLAGFDRRGAFPWLDVALEWEDDAAYLHKRAAVAEDFVALVEAVSIACERTPTLPGPSREAAIARLKSLPAFADLRPGLFERPLVGVHPASGSPMRQWPREHFATLIDLLVGALDVDVAIVGSPGEAETAAEVLEAVQAKDRVWSLVGLTDLADLPTLLSTMRLFVGNNSGPQHLAAALGVPTIGVQSGVVSAREWGPVGPMAVALQRDMSCSPCYLDKASLCPRGLACLTGLRPGDVFAMCERMLAPDMRSADA